PVERLERCGDRDERRFAEHAELEAAHAAADDHALEAEGFEQPRRAHAASEYVRLFALGDLASEPKRVPEARRADGGLVERALGPISSSLGVAIRHVDRPVEERVDAEAVGGAEDVDARAELRGVGLAVALVDEALARSLDFGGRSERVPYAHRPRCGRGDVR